MACALASMMRRSPWATLESRWSESGGSETSRDDWGSGIGFGWTAGKGRGAAGARAPRGPGRPVSRSIPTVTSARACGGSASLQACSASSCSSPSGRSGPKGRACEAHWRSICHVLGHEHTHGGRTAVLGGDRRRRGPHPRGQLPALRNPPFILGGLVLFAVSSPSWFKDKAGGEFEGTEAGRRAAVVVEARSRRRRPT